MFERATREWRMSPQIADVQPLDASEIAADGQRVEQRLGRMLVRWQKPALITEQYDLARREQQPPRPPGVVAHDQNVGTHGVQRHRGIDQRLALFDARGPDRHVHHVGAEPFPAQFERRLGAGRGLEEEIDLGAPAQGRALFLDLAGDGDRLLGEVEQRLYFKATEVSPSMPSRWRWEKTGGGVIGRRGYRARAASGQIRIGETHVRTDIVDDVLKNGQTSAVDVGWTRKKKGEKR